MVFRRGPANVDEAGEVAVDSGLPRIPLQQVNWGRPIVRRHPHLSLALPQ